MKFLQNIPPYLFFYWQGRCRKNFHFLRDGYPPCRTG
ncbi:Uncharacterised protein [Klebsiella michiganensis]|uniref:Uncharacterized protein n=1 Tax=Klebsiella michiganensis TaxID=1134687 RepID=A0A7H4PR57_9ENTR|nr:Uncharacterised protein [Klebsiella michiganensis]